MKKKLLSLGLALFFAGLAVNAQNNLSSPPTHIYKNTPVLNLASPDMSQIRAEDLERDRKGQLYRIGVSMFTNITTTNAGLWTTLPDGGKIWQLRFKSPGAEALGFLFSAFHIYDDASVEVFSQNGTLLHDRLTKEDVLEHGQQHIDLCFGEEMVLQIREPKGTRASEILLSEVMYGYRDTGNKIQKDFGDSESCQVNINCSEGTDWQDEKRGVARILVKDGNQYGWCSGSLVNNTANNCKPLFLTALHCGVTSSTADFNQWRFYFKYEAAGCTSPNSQGSLGGSATSITGAVKLANSNDGGGDYGSDFLLVQLGTIAGEAATIAKLKTPAISAYWNGWDANNTAATAGVSIHHPAGDIKKVSTFNSALGSSTWSNVPNTHWRVRWVTTTNGSGVTEGGSSGSPLFTYNGGNSRIVGTLTGGSSYCTSVSSPDFYGKVSYHWQSNTTAGNVPLKTYLDPANTGALVINGSSDPCTLTAPNAQFSGTPLSVMTGGTVQFSNLSTNATTWAWTIVPGTAGTAWSFTGGTSATSQNPQVQFNTVGKYSVALVASNGTGSDTESKINYVAVYNSAAGIDESPVFATVSVYPNPVTEQLSIDLTDLPATHVSIEVYDITGKLLHTVKDKSGSVVEINMAGLAGGVYQVILKSGENTSIRRVIKQ